MHCNAFLVPAAVATWERQVEEAQERRRNFAVHGIADAKTENFCLLRWLVLTLRIADDQRVEKRPEQQAVGGCRAHAQEY